ncbi:MAG: hypothetical protein IPQ18_04530 [Saprospiraceae bacterium]|nr:hypothetical protein [Saprospiraceae bacterium]
MNFPIISNETWLNKVKTELKSKEFQDLVFKIDKDINISPIYFENKFEVFFPAIKDWHIGDIFSQKNYSNAKDLNEVILKALNFGADTIIVENMNFSDQDIITKEVDLEIMDFWMTTDEGFQKLKTNTCINYKRIPLNLSKPIVSELSTGLKKFKQNLTEQQNSIFVIEPSDDFFLNIATVQSLQILVKNLTKASSNNLDYQYLALISHHVSQNPIEKAVIQSTLKALSCAISGIDSIAIRPYSDTESSRRITRNIQHILKMETKINKSLHPLENNYLLKNMVQSICQKVWSEL